MSLRPRWLVKVADLQWLGVHGSEDEGWRSTSAPLVGTLREVASATDAGYRSRPGVYLAV